MSSDIRQLFNRIKDGQECSQEKLHFVRTFLNALLDSVKFVHDF